MGEYPRQSPDACPMYLPENHAQMFDILTELRVYAAMHRLPNLAEKLDDALVLLEAEARRAGHVKPASAAQDKV
jgi:hypothetical protein